MSENIKAVISWYAVHRPDLLPQIQSLLQNESIVGMIGAAFEAGRCFQFANPECPLGPIVDGEWKTIDAVSADSREREVKAKICGCGGLSADDFEDEDEMGRSSGCPDMR